jgi:hypothetical protein
MDRSGSALARRSFRRWARNEVNLPVRLEILVAGGRRFTTGSAVLRDVSLKGARLGRLALRRQALPARPFTIRLQFKSRDYRGVGALCRPVRFGRGPEFELAVEFEDFWASAEPKA